MTPIVSPNILAIGYDVIQNILNVQFLSGQIYVYQGVTPETYEEMKASPSIGSFYRKNIKNKFDGAKENTVYIEGAGEGNGDVNQTLR